MASSVMTNNVTIHWKGTAVITRPKAAMSVATMILITTMPITHGLGANDQNGSRVRVIRMVSTYLGGTYILNFKIKREEAHSKNQPTDGKNSGDRCQLWHIPFFGDGGWPGLVGS